MTSFRFCFIALILLILSGCETAYKLKIDGPKKISYGERLQFEVKEENDQSIDSVSFYINGTEITSEVLFSCSVYVDVTLHLGRSVHASRCDRE